MKKRVIAILLTLCLLLSAFFFGSAATDSELEALQSAHPYSNDLYQTWTHTEKGAYQIAMTFSEDTFVEDGSDYIYILNEQNEQIGCYTADELAGKTVTVPGEVVKIRLTSDGSVTGYGFKVTDIHAISSDASAPLNLLKHIDGLNIGLSDAAADINGDGDATVYDAVKMLQIQKQQNASPAPYDAANKLKVISYNIRCANDGNGNDIVDRAPRLEKVIKERDPDLIGMQEVTNTWMDTYLLPYFQDDYNYIMKYRQDSATSKEGTPIFWKKDKFELVDSGYFWLSETPDKESLGWDASHYRICCWVKLKIKATGEIFLYYNTHYDFSDVCGEGSTNLVLERAKEEGGFTQYPVIFTADCNMTQYTPGYNAFVENGMLDINIELDALPNTVTGNGYHKTTDHTGSPIDFCFYYDEMIHPLYYNLIDEYLLDGYVSDHKGLYLEMAIRS